MKIFSVIPGLLLVVFFCGPAFLFSQKNKVQNSGFECSLCCNKNNKADTALPAALEFSRGINSHFYQLNCAAAEHVPANVFGFQKPYSGNAYAGICTHFFEFISLALDSALIAGKEYEVGLRLSLANISRDFSYQMNMYFMQDDAMDREKIKRIKPQVLFNNNSGYSDTLEWVLLKSKYKATGGEKFVFIAFVDKYLTEISAHYYVDDVFVNDLSERRMVIEANKPLILKNVNFESGKAIITQNSFEELEHIVLELKKINYKQIFISGHTDNAGNENYNIQLSEKRARAIADYFIAKGIEKSRISCKGFGSRKPISDNNTIEGKSKNRRVECVISM